jgi:hypothetical protein
VDYCTKSFPAAMLQSTRHDADLASGGCPRQLSCLLSTTAHGRTPRVSNADTCPRHVATSVLPFGSLFFPAPQLASQIKRPLSAAPSPRAPVSRTSPSLPFPARFPRRSKDNDSDSSTAGSRYALQHPLFYMCVLSLPPDMSRF